jgi:hypothetical protein
VLDLIPRIGFMDLKEQLLGRAVERGFHVAVCDLKAGRPVRIRTRRQLLSASGAAHPLTASTRNGLLARSRFGANCICDGAEVAESAHVLDSVVMPGARVEEGAVVVRSVVFDGGIVRRGVAVVDCCVSTLGVFTDADLSVAGLPE